MTGSPSTSPPGSAPEAFGFDYAIMQPNYAFDANASEQRIADTAALCKKYGLGIEMEFGGINDKYISQFRSYLTQGAGRQALPIRTTA